jgi:menaquinone-dependent protoporphyrinogen oxidase
MKILVLYATSEGQTRKIAEYAAECLRGRQHDVTLADAAANLSQLDLHAFGATILASRVHAGRHHRAIIAFAKQHDKLLRAMETAFLSVSMSAAHHSAQDSEKLAQYRAGFVKAVGWEPGRYHDVAGARLYARHNRLTRWILGMVDRHQFDTSKDHEFTDWLDLRTFIDDWASGLAAGESSDLPFHRIDRPARDAG